MTDALITDLAQIGSVKLISRTSRRINRPMTWAALMAAGRRYFCTMIEADNGFLPLSRKLGKTGRQKNRAILHSRIYFKPSSPLYCWVIP